MASAEGWNTLSACSVSSTVRPVEAKGSTEEKNDRCESSKPIKSVVLLDKHIELFLPSGITVSQNIV